MALTWLELQLVQGWHRQILNIGVWRLMPLWHLWVLNMPMTHLVEADWEIMLWQIPPS